VVEVQLEDVIEQLVELQTQLAFHEDTVAALNEAMAGQQQEILVLRQQLTLLKQRQEEAQAQLEQGGPPAAMEKPPHY
jgi:SlyX protein